ncbi:MAG TPA: lactate utilization protein [Clostridia bacterium]|nr:lactate utilization protein [Clostridia bacterium]
MQNQARLEAYELTSALLIKRLERNGMDGFYCPTAEAAFEAAKRFLFPGCSVSWGGSVTLNEIGLLDYLRGSDYKLFDRSTVKSEGELRKLYSETMLADVYYMSSNAITLKGELINIDGNGNRVGCLVSGPSTVVVIAGMNKLVSTVEEGFNRTRNLVAPSNAHRLNYDTGCFYAGVCTECLKDDCMCCQMVITRKSRQKGRIKVILVGENLGY